MKKMKRLMWGCILIVATALLAGCGSDGTSLMVDGQRATQALIDTLEADLATAQTDLATAQDDLAMAQANLKTAQDDLATAQDDLADTQADLTATEEELAAAQATLKTAQADLKMAQDDLATANSRIEDLEAKLADLQPAPADPMAAALMKAITSTGTRPGGSDLSGDFELKAGGEIVLDGDSLEKDDKFGSDEFRNANQAPPSISGWNGNTYTRMIENEKDTLTVYSNAERNKSASYMMYFSTTTGNNPRPTIVTAIADDQDNQKYDAVPAGTTQDGTLTFAVTTVTAGNAKLLDATLFARPAAGVTSRTYSGVTDNKANEHSGMFSGIPGTYVCGTSSGCVVSFDTTTGRVTGFTNANDWTFRPEVASARGRVAGVIMDADYLSFGYWMQTVTDSSGNMTYGINTFYAGSDSYQWASGATPSDLGNATYNGDAAGFYSRRAVTADGVGNPVEAGKFTADVTLKASFAGTDVAADNNYSITGTVNNFMDDQGDTISDSWSLKLDKATFGTDGGGAPTEAEHWTFDDGKTMGGGKEGTWEGAFYGNPAADATGKARQPSSVAGEFTGNFLDGSVIGAFGATK